MPGPDSISRRLSGDARSFLAAGYALLIQVAHPTVGAGVAEHSNFKEDPWGRLLRTLDFTNGLVYGDPQTAAGIGRAVRGIHTQIKGVRPDGVRYHALEPEAYGWVHVTLFDAIVRVHHHFGIALDHGEVVRFYGEWTKLGRLLGVRERDLPATHAEFAEYYEWMITERLEPTPTVYDVLETLAHPAAPPLPAALRPGFALGGPAMGRAQRLVTVRLLPRALRERFGVKLSRTERLEVAALGRVARTATPLMPASLRNTATGYMRWRHEEIGRLAAAGEMAAAA
ncbi:MAG: DUF2236 domain-containing protein [Thermoleophilaceae bacterium]|nr:DUF2236 domain-containing protein [Thermoleophilaceae bacterium]